MSYIYSMVAINRFITILILSNIKIIMKYHLKYIFNKLIWNIQIIVIKIVGLI